MARQQLGWTTTIPKVEGWFWMKYRGKHGTVVCPGQVCIIDTETLVTSARNDTFMCGPNHGGPKLSYYGKVDPSIRFWLVQMEEPPYPYKGINSIKHSHLF